MIRHIKSVVFIAALLAAFPAGARAAAGKPVLVPDAGGHTARVTRVLFTPDGKELISVSVDKTIRVWDTATGEPLRVLRPPIGSGTEGALYAAALSPDGKLLAVGGVGAVADKGGTIYLIDLGSGTMQRLLRGHTSLIFALAFSADGQQLASASGDRTARVWDVSTGTSVQVLTGHAGSVAGVAFAPDGKRLATASYDRTGRIWSVKTGVPEAILSGHDKEVYCVAWSPDGATVATGSFDQSVRLWDAAGAALRTFGNLKNQIYSLAFTPDSRRILLTRGIGGPFICALLDRETGVEVVRFAKHTNSVFHGALSRDGTLAATAGGNDYEIYLWRTADATATLRLASGSRIAWSAAWERTGPAIAWGNSTKGNALKLERPLEHSLRLSNLEFSSAVGADVRQAQLTRGAMSLEKTGRSTVAVRHGNVTTAELKLLSEHDEAKCFTLLPDNRAVVGTGYGLYMFDTNTGRLLASLRGFAGEVWAVAPSPDNRYLLASTGDQTLRVWNLEPVQRVEHNSLGFYWGNHNGSWVVSQVFPDGPAGRDGRLHPGDHVLAVAAAQGDFTDLTGATPAEAARLIRAAGDPVRFKVRPAGKEEPIVCELAHGPATVATLRTDPLLSLFAVGDEWIVFAPEGYYAASRGGERLMGWHVNNGPDQLASFYPAAQLRKTLYRPDVIERLLDAGTLEAALNQADAAAGKATQEVEVAHVLPPRVRIISPERSGQRSVASRLTVRAEATDDARPIASMQLLLDGRPVQTKAIAPPRTGRVVEPFELDLAPGTHRLAVRAVSAAGTGVSDEIEVGSGQPGGPAKLKAGNLHVLAIGINQYAAPIQRLNAAVADAQAIGRAFQDNGKKLFRSIDVKLLTDREATRTNILKALDHLAATAKPSDLVVVFYAGHGESASTGQLQLVPVDANPSRLNDTGVSGETLKAKLGGLPATTLLILDACYSGSFSGIRKRSVPTGTDRLMRELIYEQGLVVMCGAAKDQEAAEEHGHGFFTQAIVEGLSGKALRDQDGLVDISALQIYVERRVRKLSNDQQFPTIHRPSTIRVFAVALP